MHNEDLVQRILESVHSQFYDGKISYEDLRKDLHEILKFNNVKTTDKKVLSKINKVGNYKNKL